MGGKNCLKRMLSLLLVFLMLPVTSVKAEAIAKYEADEKLVSTQAEFIDAIQNKSIEKIYLGADIAMTENVSNIPERIGGLTIIGHPKDNSSFYYTYTDNNSAVVNSTLNGLITNITFYQMNINIRNFYGVYRHTDDNVTITFNEVTGQASQLVYGSKDNTNVVINNSDIKIIINSREGELVEGAASVTFMGDVSVDKTSTAAGFQMFDAVRDITFAGNSNVKLKSLTGFCRAELACVTIKKGANVEFIYTGAAKNSWTLWTEQLTINESASLLVYHNYDGALYAKKINLKNPKMFTIINKGGVAISKDTSLSATDLQSVRYFNRSQASNVYDENTFSYNENLTPTIWWAQTEPFHVETTNWYDGTAVTTNYSSSKLPNDGRVYATAIDNSNLGVNTQGAYAVEIRSDSLIETQTSLSIANAESKSYNSAFLILKAENPNTGAGQAIYGVRWLRESVLSSADYNTYNAFDAAYTATDDVHKGRDDSTGFVLMSGDKKNEATYEMSINRNGSYWVEVTYTCGEFGTVHRDYANLVVDNIYNTKSILTRGIFNNAQMYPYLEDTSQTVGIPYDYSGLDILSNPPLEYDKFTFSIPEKYAKHWEGTMKNGLPTPYAITLDNAFKSNTLCDSNDPSKYTLTYKRLPNWWWLNSTVCYVDQNGDSVTVNGASTGVIDLPLDSESGTTVTQFREYGGRYVPPSDNTHTPIGYYVGNSFDANSYISLSSFDEFDPKYKDTRSEKLYLVYKGDMQKVTERFVIKGESRSDDFELVPNTVTLYENEDYETYPKAISGYVETGYMIENANIPDDNKIFSFVYDNYKNILAPNASQKKQFKVFLSAASLQENTVVTYYYEREIGMRTGIPISQGTAVHIYRLGTMLGQANTYILEKEQIAYTRKNYEISYTNDNSPNGNRFETRTIEGYNGQWIFEYSDNHPEKRTIMPSEDTSISFRYAYDSLNIGIPDKEQFVTEQYLIEGDDVRAISPDTKTYVLKGGNYAKQAPDTISYGGKIYYAYAHKLDDSPTVKNTIASFQTTDIQHTVTFLYREQEKLMVQYLGDTYLSGIVDKGEDVIIGFASDDVTEQVKNATKRNILGFDFDRVEFDGEQIDLEHLTPIILNKNENRILKVYYKQQASPSIITVKGMTAGQDSKELYLYNKQLSPLATSQSIEAIQMPGYAVTEAWLDAGSQGAVSSVSVNPAGGNQTVTFVYAPTTAKVTIRAVEYNDTTKNLITPIVTSAIIGEAFSYQSPAVGGYALTDAKGAETAPYAQTVTVAEDGSSEIMFYYKKATGNQKVILTDEKNAVIGYEFHTLTANEEKTIPVPILSYYTSESSARDVTWDGSSAISDITYSYTRNKLDVKLVAYSTLSNEPIEDHAVTITGQRVLEPCNYADRITDLEALVGSDFSIVPQGNTTCMVQSDPAQNEVKIWFAPKQNDAVTVEVRTKDNTLLQSYTLPVAKGESITLYPSDAPTIAGYALDQGASQMSAQAGGKIVFVMKDMRHTVTVKTVADTTNPSAATYQVLDGEGVTVYVPYIPGHTLKSYQVADGAEQTNVSGVSHIQLDAVTRDQTITFAYEKVEEAVEALYSTITIIGKAANDELYRYSIRIRKDAGIQSIEAIQMPGYAVTEAWVDAASQGAVSNVSVNPAGGNQTVTFVYAPTTAKVTIRAVEYNDTNNNLITPIVTCTIIGEEFSYQSPAVGGYALTDAKGAETAPYTQTVTVAEDGSSEIMFYYKKATGNQKVILTDEKNAVIGYEFHTLTANEEKTIPVPKLSHYTAESSARDVTWDGSSAISDITYSYTRNKLDVKLVAYSTLSNEPIEDHAVTITGQRVLEPCNYADGITDLEALVGSDFSIVPQGNTTCMVQSDPAQNEVKIWFAPKQTEAVTVEVRTEDNTLLQSYTLPAAKGETITLYPSDAPTIAGYALDQGASQMSAQAGGKIVFVMKDMRHTITVKTVADTTNPSITTYQVVDGEGVTVYVPYIPGHTLKSYQVADGAEKTNASRISHIQLDAVNQDQTITFTYEKVEETVEALYSTITIIGKATNDELYRYSIRIRKDATIQSIEAIQMPGYAVTEAWVDTASQGAVSSVSVNPANDNKMVIFVYESRQAKVEIEMLDSAQTPLCESFEVPAMIGESFDYIAPYFENHYLVSASIDGIQNYNTASGGLTTVSNQSNIITFVYDKIEIGQSILILKDKDTGEVIQNTLVDTSDFSEGENILEKPNLTHKFYDFADGNDTITVMWSSNKSFLIEVEYLKRTQDVKIVSYDVNDMDGPMDTQIILNQRLGEIVSVSAPTHAGYELLSPNTVSVVVGQGEAYFYYRAQQNDNCGTVNVIVKNGRTNAPVAGATVILDSVAQGITNEDGLCVFVKVPYNTYSIKVKANGYFSGEETVSISNSASTATVSIALSKQNTGGSSGGGSGGGAITSSKAYTVTFHSNGGSHVESQIVPSGAKVKEPKITMNGYAFDGWYRDSELTEKFDFNVAVKEDITLYAGWTEVMQCDYKAYISGYTDGTFKPDANMTRAEAASLFYNLLSDKTLSGNKIFDDVKSTDWYSEAVITLANMGIINGYADGTFRPQSTITRAEFAAISLRFTGVSVGSENACFKDVSESHWASKTIATASSKGYIQGYTNGTFKPDGNITRAEVVTLINRMLGRTIDTSVLSGLKMPFSDVSASHWAYYNILEAAVSYKYAY